MLPKDFTKEYIIQHADTINWEHVCSIACLDVIYEIADDFHEEFYWLNISKRALSENFIRKFDNKIKWNYIMNGRHVVKYSNQFFLDYCDKISWNQLDMIENRFGVKFNRVQLDAVIHKIKDGRGNK